MLRRYYKHYFYMNLTRAGSLERKALNLLGTYILFCLLLLLFYHTTICCQFCRKLIAKDLKKKKAVQKGRNSECFYVGICTFCRTFQSFILTIIAKLLISYIKLFLSYFPSLFQRTLHTYHCPAPDLLVNQNARHFAMNLCTRRKLVVSPGHVIYQLVCRKHQLSENDENQASENFAKIICMMRLKISDPNLW